METRPTHEDADVAAEVISILKEDGIEVLLNSQALEVKEDAEGRIQLRVRTAEGERVLSGSHLLVAVGRVPNTERLNLAAAGAPSTRTTAWKRACPESMPSATSLVDLRSSTFHTMTTASCGLTCLTEAMRPRLTASHPHVVFMDPQLGGIGLTERQARKQGLEVRVAKMPMNPVASALEVDEPHGLMKAIVDAESDQILGAAILGIEGGEVMTMLQMAMLGDLPYAVLRDAVFAHPTLAESMNNLFARLDT